MIDLAQLRIQGKLGQAGQGTVYRAVDAGGRALAIKVIALAPDVDRAALAARVAALVGDLMTPALLPILESGELSRAPELFARQLQVPRAAFYLVMPFVEGPSLATVRDAGPLSDLETIAILAAVAQILDRLPEGVAHGDLRAENLFLQPNGTVILADPDLFRLPRPAEDIAALGALGRSMLVEQSDSALGQELRGYLARLGGATRAADVIHSLSELTQAQGALDLPGILAPRARDLTRPAHDLAVSAVPPVRTEPAIAWRPIAVSAAIVSLAAAGAVLWATPKRPPGQRVAVPSNGVEPPAGAAFDRTGTVHHQGAIYPLAPDELADATRGYVRVHVVAPVHRFAIDDHLGRHLYEQTDFPKSGDPIYRFDLPPGSYQFAQAWGDKYTDGEPFTLEAGQAHKFDTTADILYVDPGPHRAQIERLNRNIELDGGKSDLNPMDYDP